MYRPSTCRSDVRSRALASEWPKTINCCRFRDWVRARSASAAAARASARAIVRLLYWWNVKTITSSRSAGSRSRWYLPSMSWTLSRTNRRGCRKRMIAAAMSATVRDVSLRVMRRTGPMSSRPMPFAVARGCTRRHSGRNTFCHSNLILCASGARAHSPARHGRATPPFFLRNRPPRAVRVCDGVRRADLLQGAMSRSLGKELR